MPNQIYAKIFILLEMENIMKYNGKVAIVTGAGRGIGRAIATRFAREGMKVILAARSADQLESVAREINNTGGMAVPIPTDVTNEEQVKSLVERAENEVGPIDILINNAGVMTLRTIVDTSLDEFTSIMNTNILGAFLCSKYVLPSMMGRKCGRIVNIGSMAGRRGYPSQGAYCCSKHALYGLSKVMAIECQNYGIRVHVVSPGGVLTELSEDLLASRGSSQASEWMTPEEVADGVMYVISQNGAAMTDELVLRRSMSEPWR